MTFPERMRAEVRAAAPAPAERPTFAALLAADPSLARLITIIPPYAARPDWGTTEYHELRPETVLRLKGGQR